MMERSSEVKRSALFSVDETRELKYYLQRESSNVKYARNSKT